jgi:hypothetical protein
MRQTISGLIAAIGIVAASAAPAMACGFGFGVPCVQSYAPVYSGCGGCGGWAYERLPDPVQQYYYINQGPTYTGPGNFAPYPTYQESAVSGWNAYRHAPYYYGYNGGRYADATNHYYDGAPNGEGPAIYTYHRHPHYRSWRTHSGYHYWGHRSIRYGYFAHRHYASHYGYHGMPHQYGYRGHTLRRYY